jgi:DNA-binding NtrC family response regulator
LSVIPIALPPLRERIEDIAPLAEFFLKRACTKGGTPPKSFSEGSMRKLKSYYWKGNVRELENTVERAWVLSQKNVIEEEELSFLQASEGASTNVVALTLEEKSLSLRDIEKEALVLALQKSGGRKEEAAKILGISRKTLYRKEREYGLTS